MKNNKLSLYLQKSMKKIPDLSAREQMLTVFRCVSEIAARHDGGLTVKRKEALLTVKRRLYKLVINTDAKDPLAVRAATTMILSVIKDPDCFMRETK